MPKKSAPETAPKTAAKAPKPTLNGVEAQASEELARAVVQLVIKEPFFGHLLARIPRRITDQTPTASVTLLAARPVLQANPTFLLETIRKKDERVALIKHETLHLLFKHLFRRENRDPVIYNLAADIVVNQYVKPWPLPGEPVLLSSFPEMKFEPDQSLEYYYKKLLHAYQNPDKFPDTAKKVAAFEPWDDHGDWGASDAVDQQVAESELGRWVAEAHGKAPGSLPGPLGQLVAAILREREPQLDWKKALQLFGASSRRSYLEETRKRPSRRYGTIPGHRIVRKSRLLVAVDTSGSVADADLELFFAEIRGMWRQGAEITVVECDAAVQRSWAYRGEIPKAVAGRGGTAFAPVFDWIRQQLPTRFDGCIYLTDGEGAAPPPPFPCPTLWIFTPRGRPNADIQGRKITLGQG